MAAINPQTLFAEGKCYECFAPLSTAQILKLALLARTLVALVPTADTSPQALTAYGHCYDCYGVSQYDILELALLDQIAQAA